MTTVELIGACVLCVSVLMGFCVRRQIPGWLDRVAQDIR